MRSSKQRFFAVLLAGVFVFTSCGGGGGGAAGGGKVRNAAPSGAVASALQPATDGWSFPNFPSSSYPDVNFDETDLEKFVSENFRNLNGKCISVDGNKLLVAKHSQDNEIKSLIKSKRRA